MSAHGGGRCYRRHGIPVPRAAGELEAGVSPVTARGELLDEDGHYVTAEPDES